MKNFSKKQQLCSFFKNLLMIIVSLLDLMKMFLNFKTGESIYPESSRWDGYKKIVRNIIPGENKKQLKIDPSLKNQTISQLLSQIDLRDLQIYISINKSVVKKNKYQDISFRRRDNNELENIIISYDEHHQLFCPKFKRKDELTKFLFKYIKKQIFSDYKKQTLEKEGKIPYKMIVSNYDSEFLPDKTTRKIFYSENINKKNLLLLKKKNKKATESIIKYVKESLINDLITKIYKEDEAPIFGNRVTFCEFAKMFLHSSKKHVLLFKDCVIALDTLNEVFLFG
jgi:sulfur carrier protein ThiS